MEKFDPEIRTLLKASGLSEAQIRNKEVKLTQYVKNRQFHTNYRLRPHRRTHSSAK